MHEYGFGGRLTREFPSQMSVMLTAICNLKCIHCPSHKMDKEKLGADQYFTTEMNRRMINEIATDGRGYIEYIRYAGGEPLLNADLIEIIDYAVRNSETNINITTNGTLLDDRMVREIMDTNLFSIDISIDAFSEYSYKKIRGTSNIFNRVVSGVKKLLEYRRTNNKNTRIVVSFVEQPDNSHEAKDFETFWYGEGVDYVVIRRLHSMTGHMPDIAEHLRENNTERRPCLYPWERIAVNNKGEIFFCPCDFMGNILKANIFEKSIKDVWNGAEMERLRAAHLSNCYDDFEFCRNCPDWQQTRWPNEGRSYADMMMEFNQKTH